MSIAVVAQSPNPTVPPNLVVGGLMIFSGVIECVFRGVDTGAITRDTITFTVGRVNLGTGIDPPTAGCVVSPASIAFDGPVGNALWAVDNARVTEFVNLDSGSGTSDLQVVANLAVRGANGIVLRVNYAIFYFPV
jgi:hypothetical protein